MSDEFLATEKTGRSKSKPTTTRCKSNTSAKRSASPEHDDGKVFRVTYVVDSEEGPYYTIQSAIDDAKPNSTIKITSGLYKENIVITQHSLKIESKDACPDVYIMGNKGPAVLIDIPEGGSCLIQNIRFVHKGGAGGAPNRPGQPGPIMFEKGLLPGGLASNLKGIQQ
jgi:hypothetical protein